MRAECFILTLKLPQVGDMEAQQLGQRIRFF